MRNVLVAVLAVFTMVLSARAQGGRGVFDVEGVPVSGALLTVGDELPSGPAPMVNASSPMLLNLGGYVGALTGPQVSVLAKSVKAGGRPPVVDAAGGFRRVCVVHLVDGKGAGRKRVELLAGFDGVTVARELGAAGTQGKESGPLGRVVALDADKYRQASIGWQRYRGPFGAGEPGLTDSGSAPAVVEGGGGVVEMAAPIVPSPMYLDERTFGERFISGGRANVLKVARKLADEKFFLRVPPSLDPKKPVGLLVYVNATPDGKPPAVLFKALDELGIACVGIQNAGNDRPVVDRFQLVFDA
ncbi:MAG TPA: hypothetical protein VEB22_05850, partial [Phycisphaerales bacterium]|nr:hypothetical protein [Phycisphaerales bacterium]